MLIDLPSPIAAYIAAENQGDTDALAQCFAEHAIVQDEGKTIEGLAAIREWKAETKRKYQHTIEPLASAQKDNQTIVTNRSPEIFLAAQSSLSSFSRSRVTRSHRLRSVHDPAPLQSKK